MKYFYSYFLICAVFLASFLSGLVSYPVFSTTATITPEQQTILNDANEHEHNIVSSPMTVSVVSLDWFDTVNSLFPKYTDTRVIDVLTKTVYVVQRTGGYNHADVEPINVENKNLFHSIYNYTWSWARRPVWVEINDMWVAGSVNGMPHGYSLITDNGQDGHSCIHFLNSKTHGTKKVDEAHQNAIAYALAHASEIVV